VKRDVHRIFDVGGGSGIITHHLDEYCNVKEMLMTDACGSLKSILG
jgi:methylase of polypeptide subunit release factors